MNSVPSSHQKTVTQDIEIPPLSVQILFSGAGSAGHNIHHAVAPFRVAISPAAGGIRLTGDEIAVSLIVEMMRRIAEATKAGHAITEPMVNAVAASTVNDALKHALSFRLNGIHSSVRPMSLSQVAFMNAMLSSDRPLIFGVGPTGTGKTHLAIAAGLNLVADKRFKAWSSPGPGGWWMATS